MKKIKVTVLLNIGTADAKQYGIDLFKEGDVVTVDQDKGELMLKKGWAALGDQSAALKAGQPLKMGEATIPGAQASEAEATVETEAEAEGGEGTSPVADQTAPEAIDAISRMTSKDRLQSIIDNDNRTTVKDAASKRLTQL